jgi:hypothetical protein
MTRGLGGRWRFGAVCATAAALCLPAAAAAHLLDHSPPAFHQEGPPSLAFQSGPENAKWEFVASFPTGNPQTDLDFFTQKGKTYASVGTLAIGPNGGGQTIFQLADGNTVDPHFVANVPTASCVSNPDAALGLQHDVEATPKGNAILNTDVQRAVRKDTQLILDATDAEGRCHDQGVLGIENAPQGGLEIVDVTDVGKPVTIGLTSHIGEAHTVNVDPKRPHIAYAVTSDAIGVDADGKRLNEKAGSDALDLDGFEIVDLASCMNFPAGTSVEAKRAACRPKVYRYRYPSQDMGRGHTNKVSTSNGVFGCHELEVYPDDRLTCAAGNATMLFDMKDVFDDHGTPNDYSDDTVRGTPLPCAVRDSSSAPQFATGAKVTDCVAGANNADLSVPGWLKLGAPSVAGVKWLGSAYHQGRETTQGSVNPHFPSTEDIDFSHEAELTSSGRYILATDERGGGVLPPGASCAPGVDNPNGNGGIHAYRVDSLQTKLPADANEAWKSYARNSQNGKAIYRAPIRTQPQDSLCTAHVFQQIPGQNRIFMAWYSQGTQVVDFVEHPNGTIDFKEAAYFRPENADEWVSAVYRVDRNPDGSFTYWGTAGDFNFGNAGRNSVDLYKVTLPAPPAPAARLPGTGAGFAPLGRLKISRAPLTIKRRAATVRLSCLSGEVCLGRLRIVTSRKVRTRSGKMAYVTLGKRAFTLRAGARNAKLRIPISATGVRVASGRKGVQVKANALVRFGKSRAFAVRKTLRARARR